MTENEKKFEEAYKNYQETIKRAEKTIEEINKDIEKSHIDAIIREEEERAQLKLGFLWLVIFSIACIAGCIIVNLP